ncbi:MAG: DNA mismatch repair protein MutS, partial [Planctomycetota bacterium]
MASQPASEKAAKRKPKADKDPWSTPAMLQFRAFKQEQPSCVLFFRMGDFYELFGEDAESVAPALGLAITHRGNGIPVAGVPHHQRDRYLRRATAAGFRVAVVDQVQDPKEAKGVVDRAITQVVTPGTLVDETLLRDDAAAALAGVTFDSDGDAHAAVAEISTGAFSLWSGPSDWLADELARRSVRVVIYRESDTEDGPPAVLREAVYRAGAATTERPAWQFRGTEALESLCSAFGVRTLEGFGLRDEDPAVPAAGAVVAYLRETQSIGSAPTEATSGGEFQRLRSSLAHLRVPARESDDGVCVLDTVSLRALEVERTLRSGPEGGGSIRGSLLGVFLDAAAGPRCLLRTPMGKRCIRTWLCRPLANRAGIIERQDAVSALVGDRRFAGELGEALDGMLDVERIAARIALGRPTPRDVVGLGSAVGRLEVLVPLIGSTPALAARAELARELAETLVPLSRMIGDRCVEGPPAHLRQGGLFCDGFDAELDEARGLQRDAGSWLSAYQEQLIGEHELPSLRVGFNKVFGYYIELPAAQARRAPAVFSRKQTLKNAERFITPELKTFEDKVTTAESRAVLREHQLFADLVGACAEHVGAVGRFAGVVSELDALLALAEKAAHRGWVRPDI